MPAFRASHLRTYAESALKLHNVPEGDARWISHLLVKAHIQGHSSHGLGFLPQYLLGLKNGLANPRPNIRAIKETPTMCMLDGDLGLGQVVAKFAVELAAKKASTQSVFAVSFKRTLHLGRLADFTEIGAKHGLITLMWTNVSKPFLAPYGGSQARLGANPFSVSVPGKETPFMTFDASSSIVSVGKVKLKMEKGEPIPPNWLIDNSGQPTIDPNVLWNEPRGAIRPYGEHRGFGQALLAEILGGILAGSGLADFAQKPVLNGGMIIVLRTEDFLPMIDFFNLSEKLKQSIKSTPPAPGFSGVRLPGEMRAEDNDPEIEIPDIVWTDLKKYLPEI